MRRFSFLIAVLFSLTLSAQEIHYEFSAPNAVHHEAEITVTVKKLKPGPVIFRMSRSSPGRYATHEFGKNVYNVSAVNGAGKMLVVKKIDGDVYRVDQHQGTVKLKYTLYGNHADGTYASIDAEGYHLNMPAAFMFVKGLDNAPITISFDLPHKDWKIATQLKPMNDPVTFSAPNLQYFMDAPTKVADLNIREWELSNPDQKKYTFRLALEANAADSVINPFTEKLKRIVQEAQAVYGEVPAYDYGTYTFIASLNPYAFGDGMEHRNSTMISSRRVFTGANNFLNTFAHEFFHCWNVERIRPKSLEPFNFEKSNMSESLWLAEGFTSYYTSLLMKRAELISDQDFNMQMAALVNAKENTPGGKYYSPVENSQRAVFVDAGVAVDETNYPNMFTSYYSYGAALALALDLQLRNLPGKSLDGFMQQLWKNFGKTEKPYTLPQVQQVLAAYSTPGFANEFFSKHIYGHVSINYEKLLNSAGLQTKKAFEARAWIGDLRFAPESNQLFITSNTILNTPLYKAGVDVNDILLQLGNVTVHTPQDVEDILAKHKPGETIKLVFKHRDRTLETNITLEESPVLTIIPIESTGKAITAFQKAFRDNWLQSKLNEVRMRATE